MELLIGVVDATHECGLKHEGYNNIHGYILICRWQKGRLGYKEKRFAVRMVKLWHRLPREAVVVPFHSRSGWMGI